MLLHGFTSRAEIPRSFTCGIKYQHVTMSFPVLVFILKLRTYNYMFIAYLRRELGGDQPVTNWTLHGKHNNNTAISRLHFEAFS